MEDNNENGAEVRGIDSLCFSSVLLYDSVAKIFAILNFSLNEFIVFSIYYISKTIQSKKRGNQKVTLFA